MLGRFAEDYPDQVRKSATLAEPCKELSALVQPFDLSNRLAVVFIEQIFRINAIVV